MNFNEPKGEWGGPWTQRKLDAFSKYVLSYLKILGKHPYWKTIYFDGFAGSGSKEKDEKSETYIQLKLTEEEENIYKGSAERVLTISTEHSFDYYYFIDKNENSLKKLKHKLEENLNLENKKLEFRSGDSNKWVLELANALKKGKYAALIFLDPFGMQIDWDTIEALKGTRSDVWILVPTGVIVNRLLDRRGKLRNIKKLESFFGLTEEEIKNEFYIEEKNYTLFGEEDTIRKVSKPIEKIARIYAQKMKTIWPHVTEEPLRLDNRNGVPIFHFVFASNNKTALKIANQIIKGI